MKQASIKVFDDHVADKAPHGGKYLVTKYTSLEHTELFASAHQIGLQAVADGIEARAPVPLVVIVEHSANGYDWKPKGALPELVGAIPPSAPTATFVGGERWPTRPSQRFVRLRIDVGDGKNPFALNLKIHVTARIRAAKLPPERLIPAELLVPFPTTASLFGVRGETLREIHALVRSSQHLDAALRYDFVMRTMSPRSKQEVWQLVQRLRGLDAQSKALLVSMARGLIRLLTTPEDAVEEEVQA